MRYIRNETKRRLLELREKSERVTALMQVELAGLDWTGG